MKTKLSTNSIVKLILMEVVVVLIYFMSIGAWVEIITCICTDIFSVVDLNIGHLGEEDIENLTIVRNISFCVITLMQIVAASFFLNNIPYWLCSLVPQFTLVSLLWLVWSKMDWFLTLQKEDSLSFLTHYWISIATIFGAQLIGVLINFLFRWIARKRRARKQTACAA